MTELPTAPPPDTTTTANVRAAEYAKWAERDRQQEARITFLEARLAKARTDAQHTTSTQRTTGRIVDLESELGSTRAYLRATDHDLVLAQTRIADLESELWSTRDQLAATKLNLNLALADLVLAHKHIALISRLAAARRWWQR